MFVYLRSVSLKSGVCGRRGARRRRRAAPGGRRRSRTRSPSPAPATPWPPTATAPSAKPSSTQITTPRPSPIAPPAPAPTSIDLPAGTITFAIPNPRQLARPAGDSEQHAAWGDLDILSSMTINGHPAGTTIDADELDRVFDINPDVDSLPETVTPAITVQINELTMTNARQNQSGAVRIQARATVAMDRCTVSNSNSWADDGGGIYLFTDGALTLTNSTISGNNALIIGGGIRSDGTLIIVSSTITDNDTQRFGNLAQGLIAAAPARCATPSSPATARRPRGDTAARSPASATTSSARPPTTWATPSPHHADHRRPVRHRRGGGRPAGARQ